jgi:hypothetical protein
MTDCERCLAIHGPGCAAVCRDEVSGLLVCAFCEDGEPCPVQQRKAKAADAGAIPTNGATKIPTRTRRARTLSGSTTEEDTMATAIRVCGFPGCDKKLSSNNSTDPPRCQAHGGGSARTTPAVHGTCTGCGAKLAHNNSTGLCVKCGGGEGPHRARSAPPAVHAPAPAPVHAEPSNDANGHASHPPAAPTAPSNGHAGNGHAHPPINGHDVLLEERISRAMSLIPTSQRLAWIATWLSGEC